jgi:PKD repeat protein
MPSANFSVSSPTVVLGNPFVFTNNSSNAVSYTWYFGDGNSSNVASPSYTYANAGNYVVQLTAISACGDSSNYIANLQVLSSPLSIAALTANENISVGKDANGVYVQMNYDKATKATVSVCNILGQQLITGKVIEGSTERFYLDLAAKEQILLVTVAVDGKPSTTRVFN